MRRGPARGQLLKLLLTQAHLALAHGGGAAGAEVIVNFLVREHEQEACAQFLHDVLRDKDLAFVINAQGVVKQEISDDPGPGTDATESSFSSMLADSVLQSMGHNQ